MPASTSSPHRIGSFGITTGSLVRVALGVAFSWLSVAQFAACAASPRFAGPLPTRNQHPAQLTVVHLDPDGATPLPADQGRARFDLSYTSLFLAGSGGGDFFQMDGETARFGVKMSYGLGHGIEAGFELPFGHSEGGFLDSFVIDWHQFFGFPDQGREAAPRDGFNVVGRRQGREIYRLEEERGTLLDIPLHLSWTPWPVTEQRPFGIRLRGAVELPTGNEDRGYSSGGLDWAVGISTEWRTGAFAWTAHASHSFAHTPAPARRQQFRFRDVTAVGAGVEWAASNDLNILVQTQWETSTLRGLAVDRANDPQWLLWTGARLRVAPRMAIELALGEDLSSYIAPDFTAYIGIVLDLGTSKEWP